MKSVVILAVAVLALSLNAQAQHHGGGHGGGHHGGGHGGGWGGGHHGGGHHHGDDVYVACAPEVLSNNLQTADQVLGQLSNSELKANTTFTAKIAEVAAISSSQEKTEAYMSLVGVNADNAEEVLNFLYAREASGSQVLAAQKNLDLSADQATLVINKLTEALKPLN